MNPNIRSQASVWEQVAEYVTANPQGVGRLQVAEHFAIAKGTAAYHLNKGVERGKLIKLYTWVTQNSRGWVYYNPRYFDELQNSGLDNDVQP